MPKYTKYEAKEYAKKKIRGIFTAPCLPETGEHRIDEAGLRHDVRHYLDVIKSSGLYIHGFYGNFWLLTLEERKRVLEIVLGAVKGAVPVVCRVAHQNMYDTIDLIRHAEAAGADFISVIGPWGAGGSEDMVYRYFELIAAETNLGISIFNTRQAGYVMSPELMARLAGIPNVCALKNDVTMEHTIRVRHLVGDSIVVIDPIEDNFLINLTQFGQQAIYTNTNSMYDSARATPMKDYVDAGLSGDHRRAGELFFRMQPARDVHRKWVAEPWARTGLCPVSTIKFWTSELGLTSSATRPPLPEISPVAREALRRDLVAAGVIEAERLVGVGA